MCECVMCTISHAMREAANRNHDSGHNNHIAVHRLPVVLLWANHDIDGCRNDYDDTANV